MKKNRKALEKELAKAVHAHNEKIRYHESKGVSGLPQREKARELKKELKTAQDFNREINRLRRFGAADVTKKTTIGRNNNIEITVYEKQEIQREIELINQRRARKLKKIREMEVSVSGNKTGYKRGQMPSFREADLYSKKLNWKRFGSKKEFEMYMLTVEKQRMSNYFEKRAEAFKANYIEALKTQYGAANVKPLIEAISRMESLTAEELYYSEQDATIEYVYTPTDNEDTKLANLYNIWGVKAKPPEYADIEL